MSEDVGDGSYVKYSLGLSAKEYANKLLAIIREYEKYGLKELLVEKVEEELNDSMDLYQTAGFWESDAPLTKYMSDYEDIVNNKKVKYYKDKESKDDEFMF